MAVEITNLSTLTPTSITVDETGQIITIESTTTAVEINSGTVNYTISGGGITFVGDDSTGTKVSDNETFKIAGTGGITTSVSGDILTVDGSAITGASAQGITFVGDDSTGTRISDNETIKIAGGTGITTAMSGDTLTITGPNLSSYLTNSQITVVGDDSTGTTLNTGETIKIAGTSNITTAVSGDTLTITGPNLSSYITNSPLTIVGDDSTGTTLNTGETIKIAGTQNITTAVSGDTLTITGPNLSSFITASSTNTLTNKTLTSPKIDLIKDANDNEILSLSATPSATDYLVVKNGIGVGSPLHIYAEGDSANIGVHLQPKGSGIFTISDGTDFNKGIRFRSSSSAASAITLIDAVSTAGRVLTLPDATDTLVGRATTDTLTNKTFNANGTGNSITNIEVADLAAGVLDTDLSTVSASDDTVPSAKAVKAYIDAQNTAQALTFVGDDSTGTAVNSGETFKIAGTQNITTAVSGDTLTITGPDLTSFATATSTTTFTNKSGNISQWTNNSGYLTNSPLTVVGDDSTGATLNTGETIKIAGGTGITTAVSGDVLTITATGGASAQGITVVGDDSTGTLISDGETVKIAGGTGITTAVSGDVLTITATGGGGSTGDLTITGTTISAGTTNADITLTSSGTGDVYLTADTVRVGDSNATATITSNGTGDLILTANAGSTSGSITIPYSDNDISITPFSTGNINLNADTISVGDANANATITTNGTGNLILQTGSSPTGNITITQGANANISITPNGTGSIVLDGINWPQADGTSGQVLTTNGAGQLSFNAVNGDLTITGTTISAGTTNADITITSNGTGNVNLDVDTVRIGDSNTDANITTNGTGDLILNTNSGTNSGSITVADGAAGTISIIPDTTGVIDLNRAFNTTNFPQTPDSANLNWAGAASNTYVGTRMLYSNQAQGDITDETQRVRANSRVISIKHPNDSTTYNDTDYVIQNTDLTVLDINGQTFGSAHTGNRGASVRSSAQNVILKNTAGGTITGPNMTGATALAQIDGGHGGDLTVASIIGYRSLNTIRGDTADITRITNAYGFLSESMTTGGTGANGTNRIVNNDFGHWARGPLGTSLTTNYYGFYVETGTNATNKYAFYSANDDYISRLGTIERAKDKVNALTAGATVSVDTDLAPIHTITLNQNTTFSFTNLSTGQTVSLIIRQDATGSRTGTFTGVIFAGGTPTLSTAANAIDVVRIVRDGTSNLGIIDKAFA